MISTYGNWKKQQHVAQGGSGHTAICYKQNDPNKKEYIIKFLSEEKNGKLERFDNEIDTLTRLKHPGIIKIIDSYKNNTYQTGEKKWYVMDKGISITTILEDNIQLNNGSYDSKFLRQIFKNFLFLFKTLKTLHSNNIYHRDIKPENLIYFKNRTVFIDFGIAYDKVNISNITKKHDRKGLGAKFYMAPEMRREPLNSDYSKADIYSLSKTLWACLTGEYLSFDGEYSTKTFNFLYYQKCQLLKDQLNIDLKKLHNFFERNTSNEPSKRMNIDEAIDALDLFIFMCFNKTHFGRNFNMAKLERERDYFLKLFLRQLNIKIIKSLNMELNKLSSDLLDYINTSNSIKWYWNTSEQNKLRHILFYDTYIENNSLKEDILNININISTNINGKSIIITIQTILDTYEIQEYI